MVGAGSGTGVSPARPDLQKVSPSRQTERASCGLRAAGCGLRAAGRRVPDGCQTGARALRGIRYGNPKQRARVAWLRVSLL